MNFSKTSKYALRILGHMAKSENALYSAQQLHKEIDVPEKYLRRLLTDLSKSGFIKSTQGRNGGFAFSRSTSEIFLSEIIDAVDGLDAVNGCILGYDSCAFNFSCPMHEIWEVTRKNVIETITKTSLKDVQLRGTANL